MSKEEIENLLKILYSANSSDREFGYSIIENLESIEFEILPHDKELLIYKLEELIGNKLFRYIEHKLYKIDADLSMRHEEFMERKIKLAKIQRWLEKKNQS